MVRASFPYLEFLPPEGQRAASKSTSRKVSARRPNRSESEIELFVAGFHGEYGDVVFGGLIGVE
jgi:hypothetical protein